MSMRIKKNDTVKVIAGNYKGKMGRVLAVFPEQNRLIVEGVNLIKRHTRPSQRNQKGGIITKEAPIHISNVMFKCNRCNAVVKVATRKLEDGKKVRICKNCGEII